MSAETKAPRTPDRPGAWWYWNFFTEQWEKKSVQYRNGKLAGVGRAGLWLPLAFPLWGGPASGDPVCSPQEAAELQKRDFDHETRLARGQGS